MEFDLPTSASVSVAGMERCREVGTRVSIAAPTWAAADPGATYADSGFCVAGTATATNVAAGWKDASTSGVTNPTPTPRPPQPPRRHQPPPTPAPTPTPTPTPTPNSKITVAFLADSTWQVATADRPRSRTPARPPSTRGSCSSNFRQPPSLASHGQAHSPASEQP